MINLRSLREALWLSKAMSRPICFVQKLLGDSTDRVDAHYYNPKYYDTINKLELLSEQEDLNLSYLKDLFIDGVPNPTGGETPLGAIYLDDGIKFLRVQNVRENELVLDEVKYIDNGLHEQKLKRSQLNVFDILLTITGVTYGLSAVVPKDIPPANINQHVVRLRVKEQTINPYFLSYFLNSDLGKRQTDRGVTGGTRPALDYSTIKNLMILYPRSLTAQKSIVQKVTAKRNEAYILIERSTNLERTYDQTVLEMLNVQIPYEPRIKIFINQRLETNPGKDRLEVKWYYPFYQEIAHILEINSAVRLAEFKPDLTYGASVDADYTDNVPFLRINNLKKLGFDLSDLQYISGELYRSQIKNWSLDEDDILIARSGSVGLSGHIPFNLIGYTYGSYMIRLRLGIQERKDLLPQYLCIFLNSTLGRIQFDRFKTGSLQYNINTQQIREIKIIVPKKTVQRSIISKICALSTSVKALREEATQVFADARDIFQSNILKDSRS